MPDPKKVEAIKKMQTPQTKQELKTFLGMVNYLGQVIKDMSQLTHKHEATTQEKCFVSVDRKS